MSYPDDYDPEKETVKEYVDRHLNDEMKKEADAWADSVLGIELKVSDSVPPGRIQFWQDDTMIKEIVL